MILWVDAVFLCPTRQGAFPSRHYSGRFGGEVDSYSVDFRDAFPDMNREGLG